MNSIVIKPTVLKGTVVVPPSKSMSHRAIICAALSPGPCVIKNVMLSEDIKATIECMKLLGTSVDMVSESERTYELTVGRGQQDISCPVFDCGESGSTLRFLIPIAMTRCEESTFTGRGKLGERPLDAYYKIFNDCGIPYTNDGGRLPLHVTGRLKSGSYSIGGNVSSQFISGLLMALPMTEGKSEIYITGELESRGYIDMTLSAMADFGVNVQNDSYEKFTVDGGGYLPSDCTVEGDYSQAAFFLTASAIGNEIACEGLNPFSLQGDREITNILSMYDSNCKEVTIDASQIPDLVPIISVRAALKDGVTTNITHAARLRIKESDRLSSTATELNRIGADIEELPEGLIIRGKKALKGGASVDSWNDHRIAMALAVASTACKEPIELTGYEAVRKSYPSFWQDYKALGGDVHGLCLERQD